MKHLNSLSIFLILILGASVRAEVTLNASCQGLVKNFVNRHCANPALELSADGLKLAGTENSARLKNKQLLRNKETKQFWSLEWMKNENFELNCNYFDKGLEHKFKLTAKQEAATCELLTVSKVGVGTLFDKNICERFLANSGEAPAHNVCYQQAKDYLRALSELKKKKEDILGSYENYINSEYDAQLASNSSLTEVNKNLKVCRDFFVKLKKTSEKGMLKIATQLHQKTGESLDRLYKNYQSCGDLRKDLQPK